MVAGATKPTSRKVATWTIMDAVQWLKNLGLRDVAKVFEKQRIDGMMIASFGEEDGLSRDGLRELGFVLGDLITFAKERKKVMQEDAEVPAKAAPSTIRPQGRGAEVDRSRPEGRTANPEKRRKQRRSSNAEKKSQSRKPTR